MIAYYVKLSTNHNSTIFFFSGKYGPRKSKDQSSAQTADPLAYAVRLAGITADDGHSEEHTTCAKSQGQKVLSTGHFIHVFHRILNYSSAAHLHTVWLIFSERSRPQKQKSKENSSMAKVLQKAQRELQSILGTKEISFTFHSIFL